jgi:glycosyltransferase involved in cell wall biosynthesis
MKPKILYLSYNGMMEALGSSQVLSYLYKLSERYEFHLISLEKPNDLADADAYNALREKITSHGIHWTPLRYGTSKVGKMLNLLRFTRKAFQITAKEQIKFMHVRSYLPAMPAYLIKKFKDTKYIFDTRGFTFDERFDIGALKRGTILHKSMKKIETKLYKHASGINKLSELGKKTILENELFKGGSLLQNISVIPTCVDIDRFAFYERDFKEPLTIGYVGTATGWYDFDKTAKVLAKIMEKRDVKFLVFNGGQHDFIRNKLLENNIPSTAFKIEKVTFAQMPIRLKEIDIALFFIHPYFSKKASAATKLGELFASGIPVLTNKDVGDHEYYIETYKAGKIIDFDKLNEYDFNEIINSITTIETSQSCRHVAEKYFSLDKGVEDYIELYNKAFFNN